jgi:hypothetical protein
VRDDRIRGAEIDADRLRRRFGVEDIEQHAESEQVVGDRLRLVQEAAKIAQFAYFF